MENIQTPKSLVNLIKNPSELLSILSNPGKAGLDFYKSLDNKEKQYIAFAAGLGLIAYGIVLNRKQI